MIVIGSTKRLCIGVWFLAAIFLLGFNGLTLLSVFSPPVVGRSKETRLASQKWLRLENKLALTQKESFEDINVKPIVARFSPDLTVIKPQPVQAQTMNIESITQPELQLPVLTGIMKISDADGHHRSFALVEGKRLMENDRVRSFVVQKITDQGVVFFKDGLTWFVPAPDVFFSLDREG